MEAAVQGALSDHPVGDPCTIQSVINGDSFVCAGGKEVRMLGMDAPDPGECGGDWARAALANIFLTPGRTVYLRHDVTRTDQTGRTLAAPIWRGNDGADYNLAIVMVFVGLAHASDVGAGNFWLHEWAIASEAWARAASWNMWEPGKTFNGGC
jgi:endonuclease YncB( thermonuclease family)